MHDKIQSSEKGDVKLVSALKWKHTATSSKLYGLTISSRLAQSTDNITQCQWILFEQIWDRDHNVLCRKASFSENIQHILWSIIDTDLCLTGICVFSPTFGGANTEGRTIDEVVGTFSKETEGRPCEGKIEEVICLLILLTLWMLTVSPSWKI